MRMVLVLMVVIGLVGLGPSKAKADGTAGEFDYYVMALSWSANWCALEGDARQSEQCDVGAGFGWVLHGLWPQYEAGGWPDYCRTDYRNPSRSDTADQAPLFGTSGSAWHQWNKHGRCTGLSAANYYRLSQEAYDRITRPEVFRRLDRDVRLPASVVEDAFVEANPEMTRDMITVTCRSGMIQEARICLSRDLELRACAPDVSRDCTLDDALFEPMR